MPLASSAIEVRVMVPFLFLTVTTATGEADELGPSTLMRTRWLVPHHRAAGDEPDVARGHVVDADGLPAGRRAAG